MKITFDFDRNEVTDENGTIYVEGLNTKRKAILEAAGLEEVSGADLRNDINNLFAEMGADIKCAEMDMNGFKEFLFAKGLNQNGVNETLKRFDEGRPDREDRNLYGIFLEEK